MNHIVDTCPLTTFEGGLNLLHEADVNADISSYGWNLQRLQRSQNNHGLRGSASPVLTATGFVNGRGQFSTLHRIHTP